VSTRELFERCRRPRAPKERVEFAVTERVPISSDFALEQMAEHGLTSMALLAFEFERVAGEPGSEALRAILDRRARWARRKFEYRRHQPPDSASEGHSLRRTRVFRPDLYAAVETRPHTFRTSRRISNNSG
jgi:hypothetical protein